ncbi:FMN adenylyltransferase Ecym_5278 [Eremothecium cymbalariae DBVPG|uniref:FAD synthase n=1 Tax=Eremothecium cymbalariae (strain CBS 270.75 / DBVPG 7215 / KCTC 17166 / NRRL Y-17582) TaxID=931890 RepID=I6ND99_ERECY|nr:hypothetical protein Ecym_5278 [Eremothecium cymbalariae DBVPG\
MTHSFLSVAEHCHNITESYLAITSNNPTILETQSVIRLTKCYILDEVLTKWDVQTGEITFSYNGGKDCQVLLIIYLGCLYTFYHRKIVDSPYDDKYHDLPIQRLPAAYIRDSETFESLEDFVDSTVDCYCLSLYESPKDKGLSMAHAFEEYLNLYPSTKAIIIGIRHTDPYADNLMHIQKTDAGWPDFIRIQPILHWKLVNVWSFLLYSGEEICGLYGLGYTSIGSINCTTRNPHLRSERKVAAGNERNQVDNQFKWEIDHAYGKTVATDYVKLSKISPSDLDIILNNDKYSYYPGWYLINDNLERAGRLANLK